MRPIFSSRYKSGFSLWNKWLADSIMTRQSCNEVHSNRMYVIASSMEVPCAERKHGDFGTGLAGIRCVAESNMHRVFARFSIELQVCSRDPCKYQRTRNFISLLFRKRQRGKKKMKRGREICSGLLLKQIIPRNWFLPFGWS